jgi:integrase
LALVVVSFLFCLRADSVCSIRRSHVIVSESTLVLNLTKFKTKKIQEMKQLVVPLSAVLAGVVRDYLGWWDRRGLPDSSLFGFEVQRGTQPASFVTRALQRVLPLAVSSARLDTSATLSSHALRRGAAVSMHALGVQTQRMMEWAGWSSQHSMDPYIRGRASVAPLPSDYVCFGWMTPYGASFV